MGAEKLMSVMKKIEEKDIIYNPQELYKVIEKNRKTLKVDEYIEKLLSTNTNLRDYYNRYKSKYPEFYTEIVSIINQKSKK